MIESGVPGYEMTGWYALLVPSATPRAIVSKLNSTVVTAVGSPELQERFYKIGSEPMSSTPQQMLQRLREETVRLTKVITIAEIKPEYIVRSREFSQTPLLATHLNQDRPQTRRGGDQVRPFAIV